MRNAGQTIHHSHNHRPRPKRVTEMTHRKRWYVALFFLIVYVCASFVLLDRLEKKINPVGWDLSTYEKIQDLEQQTKLRAP